jgi:hypothetical protein
MESLRSTITLCKPTGLGQLTQWPYRNITTTTISHLMHRFEQPIARV